MSIAGGWVQGTADHVAALSSGVRHLFNLIMQNGLVARLPVPETESFKR